MMQLSKTASAACNSQNLLIRVVPIGFFQHNIS